MVTAVTGVVDTTLLFSRWCGTLVAPTSASHPHVLFVRLSSAEGAWFLFLQRVFEDPISGSVWILLAFVVFGISTDPNWRSLLRGDDLLGRSQLLVSPALHL